MPPPVLFIVDVNLSALEGVEAQLVRRYCRDYRVNGLSDPQEALEALAQLAHAGEEVALVLVGDALADATRGQLLERARRLHPHAKRGLMVPPSAWGDKATADAIRDAVAVGRVDYYVPRPADSRDEVFHQTISSFCLSGQPSGAWFRRLSISSARPGGAGRTN